jgi:hypothetical protein
MSELIKNAQEKIQGQIRTYEELFIELTYLPDDVTLTSIHTAMQYGEYLEERKYFEGVGEQVQVKLFNVSARRISKRESMSYVKLWLEAKKLNTQRLAEIFAPYLFEQAEYVPPPRKKKPAASTPQPPNAR